MKVKNFFFQLLCLFLLPLYSLSGVSSSYCPHSGWAIHFGDDRFQVGFFSLFGSIVGALKMYDEGKISSVKLNFGKKGLYYNPNRGDNWWEYYFEPLVFEGDKRIQVPLYVDHSIRRKLFNLSIRQSELDNHALISKYIRVKDFYLKKIDAFETENFSGRFVVGVHYRATDKFVGEAPELSKENFIEILEKECQARCLENPYFYVATDKAAFMTEMERVYPGRILSIDAERSVSGKPLHYSTLCPDKQGEEALLDCLLLSRTHLLVRTSSNLSAVSTWFNPNLPVVLVNPGQNDILKTLPQKIKKA